MTTFIVPKFVWRVFHGPAWASFPRSFYASVSEDAPCPSPSISVSPTYLHCVAESLPILSRSPSFSESPIVVVSKSSPLSFAPSEPVL